MTSIPVRTATNGQSNIAVVTLPDGTTAVAHVTIDGAANVITPASTGDIAALTTAVTALTTLLNARSLVLADAFGAPAATTVTDVFGNPVGQTGS